MLVHTSSSMLIVGILSLCFMLTPPVQAQNALTATPDQISIAGVRGKVVTRTILIRSTTSLSDIQVHTTDLASERGEAIIASAIESSIPTEQILAGDLLTMTVSINLENIPSSTYTGQLLVNHSSGMQTIPITVWVKHPWWWGFLVLFVGVALGGMLTNYRQRVRPYDEILVRAGRLRTQMRSDSNIAETFGRQIERHLFDTECALQGAHIDQAQHAIAEAEKVWQFWQRHKPNWQYQFKYIEELQATIAATFPRDTPYTQKVQQNLHDAVRDAPTMIHGPETLEQRLQLQYQAIDRYQIMYAQINELLSKTRNQESLHKRARGLEMQLNSLDPNNEHSFNSLEQQLRELDDEITQLRVNQGETTNDVLGNARGTQNNVPRVISLPTIPSLVPEIISETQAKQAVWRLQWTILVSSGFIILLLTLVGFGQIYGNNLTFGANVWTDYAALLAWGFGVEASRASITSLGSKT